MRKNVFLQYKERKRKKKGGREINKWSRTTRRIEDLKISSNRAQTGGLVGECKHYFAHVFHVTLD